MNITVFLFQCQLLVTFGFVTLFAYHTGAHDFARKNNWVVWVCLGITIVMMIAMACCEGPRRTFPTNFICLGVFTLAESLLLGCITARYRSTEVI